MIVINYNNTVSFTLKSKALKGSSLLCCFGFLETGARLILLTDSQQHKIAPKISYVAPQWDAP